MVLNFFLRLVKKWPWIQDQPFFFFFLFFRITREDNKLIYAILLEHIGTHSANSWLLRIPTVGFENYGVLQQKICNDWIKGLKTFFLKMNKSQALLIIQKISK